LPPLPAIRPNKQVWLATSLSSLFPGLGHIYLEDSVTASGLMGTSAVGIGLLSGNVFKDNFTMFETTVTTLQANFFYSIYAAYRDARAWNGISNYSYQMPTDNLMDITLAPFKWSVMKKPRVWGSIIGSLAAAITLAHYVYGSPAKLKAHAASTSPPSFIALPVGVGEEAFFRGFLQSSLSEAWNPIAGNIISSILFGAAHFGNADSDWRYYAFSMPFIAGFGAYCGWLTQSSHSLQDSVALHTWYDFILFSLAAAATQGKASVNTPTTFSFSMPF